MAEVSAGSPFLNVVIGLRGELIRCGVTRMVESIRAVRSHRVMPNLANAIAFAATLTSAVLIVAMSELTEDDVSSLLAAARSLKIVALVEDADVTSLGETTKFSSGLLAMDELDARTLEGALRRAVIGEFLMPQRLAVQLLTLSEFGPAARSDRPRMTPREQQTIQLLVEGLTNKQIARRLSVSEHGAKRLVANVLAKLDCPNRTTAVSRIFRDGLYEHYAARTPVPQH